MYAAATASIRLTALVIPPLNGLPASGSPVAAVRGFGFNHDGTVGTIDEFLTSIVFLQVDGESIATAMTSPTATRLPRAATPRTRTACPDATSRRRGRPPASG
jgi:hypothetical protein